MRVRLATILAAGLISVPLAAAGEMILLAGEIPTYELEITGKWAPGKLGDLKNHVHRPWLTGSSIALAHGETLLVVADTDNNTVAVLDAKSRKPLRQIAVGRQPERLVVHPDGRVFVTNRASRSVSVVDPVAGKELRSISAGVEPYGIALSADQRSLLVTSSATGELLVFSTARLALTARIKLDDAWPMAVAAHPDGARAYVSYLHGRGVDEVDLQAQRKTRTLALPAKGTGLPGRLMGRGEPQRIPNLAVSLTVSPLGNRLHVAHVMADTGEARSGGEALGGYGLGAANPLVATISTFDLTTGQLSRPNPDFTKNEGDISVISQSDQAAQLLAQPVALVHDPKRSRLLMVAMGSDRVMSFDSASSDPMTTAWASHEVNEAPEGLAVTADGATAFVHNAHTHDVSVLNLSGELAKPGGPARWTQATSSTEPFARSPLPATAQAGRRLFTFALKAEVGGPKRFACASCHPDGRHDGLVWHVGAGPRQTPILADRMMGTGPFNWLGTETELTANIHQTIKRLGGKGASETEQKSMAEYMQLYMPAPDNPYRDAERALVAEGRALFESEQTGCADCHTPGRLTDGQSHDVGTTSKAEWSLWERFSKDPAKRTQEQARQRQMGMDPEPIQKAPVAYDTPSLRHLWASGPYFHDGSATGLRELLTTGNKGDRMGKTSQLSSHQVGAMVAYLRTL